MLHHPKSLVHFSLSLIKDSAHTATPLQGLTRQLGFYLAGK
jgi:hypothetical protein